jgi:hypothetical protein
MAASDVRKTILEIINEARQKFALGVITSLSADLDSKLMVELLNDVVDEVSDYGNWKEMIREVQVTASVSVSDYSVETSALVKNIHEISFDTDISPMWLTTFDDILRLNRSGTFSRPRQWAIVGVDEYANPKIRVFPTPSSVENNKVFKVTYYQKPRQYTTADASVIPEFPAGMLVAGLVAAKSLEESGGVPTQQYAAYSSIFQKGIKDTYNRFNADSGSNTFFKPAFGRSRFR